VRVVADEGSGPAAVLLHGQPGDGAEFLLVRQALRGAGLRVLTVDRPGYTGDGSPATGYAGNADAIAALLDSLGIASARILGASWAGGAALAFGLAYPERTDGLLLASSVGAPGSIARADYVFALPVVVRGAAFAFSRLDWLLEWSSGSHFTPAARAMTRQGSMRWRTNGGWAAFMVEQQAMVADTGALWDRLAPFDFPCTVVQGARDLYVPVRAGRLLAGRLQTRYVEVEAGHVLHLELPALLAAELVALAPPAALGP
jgi:pimeloyl-ACP methyl ester carboxylesterase